MNHEYITELPKEVKDILEISIDVNEIHCSYVGLKAHLLKRSHEDMIPYLSKLKEIIDNPDYVGINPREKEDSIEFIKIYDDNVLLAIKIHKSGEFYYIPTMYNLQEYKLQSRIRSGRLKKIDRKTD